MTIFWLIFWLIEQAPAVTFNPMNGWAVGLIVCIVLDIT